MAYYTQEKAKYGATTGMIIPYTVQMPEGNTPAQGKWRQYLPAGFLRCNGDVFKASEYPVLASVLGIGEESKFLRPGEEIANDEFKLPDLGSKYVSGGLASGTYLNEKLTNPDSSLGYRVGAEIDVESLVGSTATITYSGYFRVQDPGKIDFTGVVAFKEITGDGTTFDAFLSNQSFQTHGHNADAGYFTYLGRWEDSIGFGFDTGAATGYNGGQNEGSNNSYFVTSPEDSSAVISHHHFIDFASPQVVKDNNTLGYELDQTTANPIDISPLGIETTINLTTSNIYKLDEATPPYILVEYLIKI